MEIDYIFKRQNEAIITRLIDRIQQNYEPHLDYGQSDDTILLLRVEMKRRENELDEIDKGIILIDVENKKNNL